MTSLSPELSAELSAYYNMRAYEIVGNEFDTQNPHHVASYTAFVNCLNCVLIDDMTIEETDSERAQCFDYPASANVEEIRAFMTRVRQAATETERNPLEDFTNMIGDIASANGAEEWSDE